MELSPDRHECDRQRLDLICPAPLQLILAHMVHVLHQLKDHTLHSPCRQLMDNYLTQDGHHPFPLPQSNCHSL